ncbi:MAG: YgfZ/GcvT domain-containing protein [Alphaproteobacteria bacterium]
MTQGPFFVTLKDRGLIKITGADRHNFLQKIITNDIDLLAKQEALYTCLLTPQGKFLHDFFISQQESSTLHVDCEGGERTLDLQEHLQKYKLHADIEIQAEPAIPFYAIFGLAFGYKDPRHEQMGYRAYQRPIGITEMPFEEWDYQRISLGIPDGSRDMIVGKTTMDEARIAQLNGLSYDKGCYIGQELTARMHYRGLGKRHLRCVKLNDMPENAQLRSSCRDLGIALTPHNTVKPNIPNNR